MEMKVCPECGRRVVPMVDGTCPSCRTRSFSGVYAAEAEVIGPTSSRRVKIDQQKVSNDPSFVQLLVYAIVAGALVSASQIFKTILDAPSRKRDAAFRTEIKKEASSLITEFECSAHDNTPLGVRDRHIVLFDSVPDDCFVAYHESDRDRMGGATEQPCTVFLARYKGTDESAAVQGEYRARFDVYCILWPERRVIGRQEIVTSDPMAPREPGSFQMINADDVLEWISTLPGWYKVSGGEIRGRHTELP